MCDLLVIWIVLFFLFFAFHEEKTCKKPFVIISKLPQSSLCGDGYSLYKSIDLDNNVNEFYELQAKYCIGDTIK